MAVHQTNEATAEAGEAHEPDPEQIFCYLQIAACPDYGCIKNTIAESLWWCCLPAYHKLWHRWHDIFPHPLFRLMYNSCNAQALQMIFVVRLFTGMQPLMLALDAPLLIEAPLMVWFWRIKMPCADFYVVAPCCNQWRGQWSTALWCHALNSRGPFSRWLWPSVATEWKHSARLYV